MKPQVLLMATVLAVTAVALPARFAGAQSGDGERVQMALERTDERIELARSLVAGADNAQAELELNAAIGLQTQARSVFQQGQSASGDLQGRMFQQALDLTIRARSRADRAISLIQGLPDPERVLSQVERTREMLERVRDRVEECNQDRARALMRVAFQMQQRAEAAVRESRYLAALQLTMSARERALRALRLCNLEENLEDAAERALRRTDDVLSRAHEIVAEGNNERARELIGRAERVQKEAHVQFRDEHFAASLRMTQSARTLAYRAIRISSGGL